MVNQDIMCAARCNPVMPVRISHASLFFQEICNDFPVPIILRTLFFVREIYDICICIYICVQSPLLGIFTFLQGARKAKFGMQIAISYRHNVITGNYIPQ